MAVRRLAHPTAPRDAAALASLAGRLERAEAEQLARTGAPYLSGALAVAGGLAVSKGPGSPSSAAFGLGLVGPVSGDELDLVEAHLGMAGGEVRIELCVHAHPSLSAELARRGYRVERLLLVLSRATGPRDVRARAGGAQVRRIGPGEERAFAHAFARAHLGRAPAPGDDAEDLLAVPRAEGGACFAAFDGPAIVGVAVASEHEGVASLSGAGVLPEHRGRGLQLALVRARLAWAARRGCEVAASAVEPGGRSQRNLESAGFRVAYAKAVMVRSGAAVTRRD
jgi:ribosomal protein S18 acetylase RimI-like enzyme